MEKKVLILYSGGLDSTLLLEMALGFKMVPFCLLVNYGQTHVKELESAERICTERNIEYRVVDIKGLRVQSKLIDGTVPYEGVSEWHVPSRNLLFVSLAAAFAESEGIPLIWYGANFDDREHLFPDCYQEWVVAVNSLLQINGSVPLRLEAPLLGLSKTAIRIMAKDTYGIEESKTFSGYGNSES